MTGKFLLVAIKLAHTLIWGFFATCIVVLPVTALLRRFRWSAILSIAILLECAILAINGGKCPLTDLAARYTADRADNFDIFLPNWLARNNKLIFGIWFVISELVVLICWLRARSAARRN